MTFVEWPIRRTLEKALPNGDYIKVVAGLHHLVGNERPYWSVTCSLWTSTGRKLSGTKRHARGYDADGGGAAHELIESVFPELRPVIAVHLADDHGVPMHAKANGWYYYSGKARRWEEQRGESWHNREGLSDRQRAARALHIPAERLPEGMSHTQFDAFVDGLDGWWQSMADEARATLDGIPV